MKPKALLSRFTKVASYIISARSKANSDSSISLDSTAKRTRRSDRKKRKRVKFGKEEDNQVHEIIHINDLEQEADTTMIWYTKEEYKQIFKHCKETVDRHLDSLLDEKSPEEAKQEAAKNSIFDTSNEGNPDEENDWCIRGLELEMELAWTKIDDGYVPIRERRMSDALNAVLNEQNYQCKRGNYDETYLANIYFDCSRQSQLEAELTAFNDWREVLVI